MNGPLIDIQYKFHIGHKFTARFLSQRMDLTGPAIIPAPFNDEEGNNLISHNAEELLIPASIIKILTSYVAIDILEKNYCYKTEFYTDANNNCNIKGWGDPYLISEEIALITDTLKRKGLTRIYGWIC